MLRRLTHSLWPAALTGTLLLASCSAGPEPPPSVVLVVVDTLRADYLGADGFQGQVSPNIDALARESVVFESCFAQAPWTKPSTASILTSLYPAAHGLTNHEGLYWGDDTRDSKLGILSDRAVTLAETLKDEGYATAAFVANPWVVRDYGFAQGFDHYDDYSVGINTRANGLVEEAITWLKQLPEDQPCFLYLHFMDVHAPYDAPKRDFEVLRSSPSLGHEAVIPDDRLPFVRWKNIEVRPEWATDAMRQRLSYWRARYASCVRAFDRRLETLVHFMRRQGLLDKAVFVLTSDHGEQLYEHQDWSHGYWLYDHQLHVPLIVRPPGGVAGGARVHAMVEQVDVMPTILSLVGCDVPATAQGRDLSAAVVGSALESRDAYGSSTEHRPGLRSLRTETHKLLFDIDTGEAWLYDLVNDRGEQRNVAEEQAATCKELEQRLVEHLQAATRNGTLDTETRTVPEELRRRLEALGY